MAKTALEQWDETAANNTDVGSVNIDEGCAPSGMNNAHREEMAQFAKWLGDDTLASAATTDLGSVPGRCVDVSGTTTITAFGTIKAGTIKFIRFTGALTLTYNATSLILYSKTSITTYNGLVMMFRSLGSGNWVEVSHTPAVVTFTPTPNFGGGTTGLAGTFTGRLTRLGNLVTLNAYFAFSAKGSSTGAFAFGGFGPIAKASPAYWPGAVSQDANFASLVAGSNAVINGGENAVRLRANITTGSVALTDVNFTNTTTFAVSITFECDP